MGRQLAGGEIISSQRPQVNGRTEENQAVTSFDDVVRHYRVDRVELTAWIKLSWVRPRETAAGWEFDDVDVARINLIRELKRDVLADPDSLGLVLSLLDQLYTARRILHTVDDAIAALPDDLRQEVEARLRRSM